MSISNDPAGERSRRPGSEPGGVPDAFARLGAAMARRPWTVASWWLSAVVLGLVLLPGLLSSLASPPYQVAGSESARASALMQSGFPVLGAEPAILVLHSERLTVADAGFQSGIKAGMVALSRQPGVASVIQLPTPGRPDPELYLGAFLAPIGNLYADQRTAFVMVNVSGDSVQRQDLAPAQQAAADAAAQAASGGAVSAYLVGVPSVGHDLQQIQIADLTRSELFAIPLAVLVLLVGLRAPVAALLPLAVAGAGVAGTLALLALLTPVLVSNGMLLIGVTAIGFGVGTDYALFVVNRYREETAAGVPPDQAAGRALATSGRTALHSGLVVVLAASCLLGVRWEAYTQLAVGAGIAIVVQVTATLTLLPAALVLLTGHLDWSPLGRRPQGATESEGVWARWSRHLMRHPWPYLVGVTAGLVALAVPAAGLKLGIDMERRALSGTATGTGLALLDQQPIRGVTGMMVVLVRRSDGAPAPDLGPLHSALRSDPLVAAVVALDNQRDLSVAFVVPKLGADSPRLAELVHRIRADIVPRSAPSGHAVLVGGPGASVVDISDEVGRKMWWVVAAVLGLLFVLMTVVFRSLLLPLKAVAVNLLVTSAALGLMVAVFQHGAGEHLLGFTNPGVTWVHVPLLVFAVVFALSLDYELFLVRRIQEEYRASGDNTEAVAVGLQRTARTITLAALIMAVAFGSLLAGSMVAVKEFGFAVAVAIVLDATAVRLALVPALMQILGRWNWWLPFASTVPRPTVPYLTVPRPTVSVGGLPVGQQPLRGLEVGDGQLFFGARQSRRGLKKDPDATAVGLTVPQADRPADSADPEVDRAKSR